jgi:hypothetical protein
MPRTASLCCTPGLAYADGLSGGGVVHHYPATGPAGARRRRAEALNAARANELPAFAVARRPAGMSGTSPQGRSASRLNKPAELRSPRTRDGERTTASRRTLTRGGPKSWGRPKGRKPTAIPRSCSRPLRLRCSMSFGIPCRKSPGSASMRRDQGRMPPGWARGCGVPVGWIGRANHPCRSFIDGGCGLVGCLDGARCL